MPVVYDQDYTLLAIRMTPWAIILLLLLIPSRNRTWRAGLALVPAFVVYGVLLLLRIVVFTDSRPFSFYSQILVVSATGLVVLLLLFHKLETFIIRTVILMTACILTVSGIINIMALSFPGFAYEMLKTYTCGVAVFITGMSITGYHTRRNFTTDRFFVWLLVWLMVISIVYQMIHFTVQAVTRNGFIVEDVVTLGITLGVMTGFILFITVLPFILLIFYNKLYLERFYSIFHFENYVTVTKTIEYDQREEVI